MSEKKPKTVAEIAGRIQYLEGVKEEYVKKKWNHQNVKHVKIALKELYWVLGVKQK